MAGYSLPLSIPRQPRSPRVKPRRDFVMTAGDDVTLELTILLDDAGGGVVDVTGAETTWKVFDASGTAIVEVVGTVEDAPTGRIDVAIDGADTLDIPGRYPHSLRIEFTNGMSTVVTGMIHFEPVAGSGGSGFADAMTPAEGTYGDWEVAELTAASAIIAGATSIGGQLTLTSDAIDALSVRGGGVFGPSDYRQVEILPTTTADGAAGMPQTFLARRVGSDDTVGASGNLWVSQSSWVLTDTTAPAGVRYNALVSTSAGAGVDPGEVWGFTSILSTQASTDSLNAVPIYGQGVRRGLPSSGVGVPIFGGVLEARSLTGASSATDGRMRSLELDIFANGADDITPGPGREALTIVLDKNDAGGAAPHVTSVIGVYTATGATCSWVLRPNLTWTEAFLDARGGTQGGSAHTIWLKSGQTIALDASAATKIGSNGSTITLTGAATVTGALTATGAFVSSSTATARLLNVVAQVSLPGNYTAAAAPFNMSMSIIRTTDPVSTASRDLMRTAINSDVHDTGQAGTALTMKSELWLLGVVGAPVADSWGGSRVMRRFFITDSNQPVSALVAPTGAGPSNTLPSWNCTWSGITTQNTRGGLAPEQGWAVGANFLDYGSIIHKSPTATATGAINLANSHLYEGGLFFFPKTSAQSAAGFGLNVALNSGVSPVYAFDAYSFGKRGRSTLGFRLGFGTSGFSNFHGLDPLRGTFAGIKGSQNDPIPTLLTGFDVRDVAFSGSALTWAGGKINGGTHGAVGTGSLDIGTGRFSNTATGASLNVSGYVGRPTGYVFTAGVDLIENDPVIAVRTSMIGDDAYGGVYRFYGANAGTNTFSRAVVLTAPIYKGVSPPATVEIELRDTSGGVTEWEITETGTTTVHPTQLTTTIDDFYVDRILRYITGPAAGQEQVITAYDAATGNLTTAAFATNPTSNVSLVVNFNFASAISGSPDTILNGWQWTVNGGTGTVTRLDVPTVEFRHVALVGDGTNAASIDQEVAFTTADNGVISVLAFGNYRIKIGPTRGSSDYLDETIIGPVYPEGETAPTYRTTRMFFSGGTAVWIRIENADTATAGLRIVRAAQGDDIVSSVRAAILTKRLEVTQSWTELDALDFQDDGGPATFGGTLDVVGDFSVAANKFTANATTGATVAAGSVTGTSFIPSSATVPTNGLYLPAGNTLGFAIASAAEMQLTGTALSAAVNGGLALGTTSLGWGSAHFSTGAVLNFVNGDVTITHASNLLTMEGGGFTFKGTRPQGDFLVETAGTSNGAPGICARGYRFDSNGSIDFGGQFFAEGVRTDAMPASGKAFGGLIFGGNTDLTPTMGYTASITAVADAAWVDTANAATAIVFRTGVAAQARAANINYGTERGRITSGGRWLLGSSTDDGSTTVQVNGTAKITGTATLAAFNASAQSTVNLSGTSISSVAGLVLGLAAVDGLGTAQLLDARAANPQISFRRANGTSTAMTALASGDIIGNIQFRGHDGSALTATRATIEATAAETWSGSANGTNLLFKTSTIGAATATTRVTITDAGNLVMATGILCRNAANVSVAAGTTRADALQLSREFTRISSAASGTGVILPTGVVGMYVTIYHDGANAVKVYANGSETIDGTAGSTGVTLTNGNACMYVFSATNTWHSFLMGGRSA